MTATDTTLTAGPAAAPKDGKKSVEIKHLDLHFGAVKVLQNLDLDIYEGDLEHVPVEGHTIRVGEGASTPA